VLLPTNQRGQFSAVAGPTDVSGVHRMRSVVAKFRLPVVVRLITRGEFARHCSTYIDDNVKQKLEGAQRVHISAKYTIML